MTDQIREQMSALLDGELPQDQIGLLVRRLERDAELRRAFGSYVLIGESLRAPGGRTAGPGFAARVQAELEAGAPAPALTRGRFALPPLRRMKHAAAVAVAAGAAFAAMLLLMPGDQRGDGGGAPALAELDVGAGTIAELAAADSASPTPAQSQRLAGYLVAHSQFATAIGRRSLWTSVLAEDPGIARVAYETYEDP
jgi:sigma-E factor negative regulatory protein RseA